MKYKTKSSLDKYDAYDYSIALSEYEEIKRNVDVLESMLGREKIDLERAWAELQRYIDNDENEEN